MHHYNSVLSLHITYQHLTMTTIVFITMYGATIQSSSGAWVWLICIISCTNVQACPCIYFNTCSTQHQYHPTFLCTFYTCSTRYLFTVRPNKKPLIIPACSKFDAVLDWRWMKFYSGCSHEHF